MIALIDGDTLAYLVCESRWRNKRGEVVVLLDKSQKLFTKEEDREYLERSYGALKKITEEICEALFADDYLMAMKSDDNYRDTIYPITFDGISPRPIWGYKANRWKSEGESNKLVRIMRQLAVCEDLAIFADGREADDMLRIWATEAERAGEDYVVVAEDKDLGCIPGKHYNPKSRELKEISHLSAMRFYYRQLLMGDPTDNIPGVPKLGPVKAEAYLKNITEEEEMQEIVVEQYLNAYGDEWRDYLLSNGKLLHIQRHVEDFFHLGDWPVARDVSLITPKRKEEKKELSFPNHAVIPRKPAIFTGTVPKC